MKNYKQNANQPLDPPPPYQSTISLDIVNQAPSYYSSTSLGHNPTGSSSSFKNYYPKDRKSVSPDETLSKSDNITSSRQNDEQIWSIIIPYISTQSSLCNLSIICKILYRLTIPHLWDTFKVQSDEQLWFILNTLVSKESGNNSKIISKFNKLGLRVNKGKGKAKEQDIIEDGFDKSPSGRLRHNLSLVKNVIFDSIPSPTLCAVIPFYIGSALSNKKKKGQADSSAIQKDNSSPSSPLSDVLLPNATNVEFSSSAIETILKFGWKPFQYNDYYAFLSREDLPIKIPRELPNKLDRLPFSNLINPKILHYSLPIPKFGSKDNYDNIDYYDNLSADGVFVELSFWNTLEEIHIYSNWTSEDLRRIVKSGIEMKPFLGGRRHYIHLTERMFRLDDHLSSTDIDDSISTTSNLKTSPKSKSKPNPDNNQNSKSELIQNLSILLEPIMENDIISNTPIEQYRITHGNSTEWIVRYPKNEEIEKIIRKVEHKLINEIREYELNSAKIVIENKIKIRGLGIEDYKSEKKENYNDLQKEVEEFKPRSVKFEQE